MAHKGKRYKLQFRRDLALNVKNNFAYPEAFSGFFDQVVNPWHPSGLDITFVCTNLSKASGKSLSWASDWTPGYGTTFRCSFDIDDAGKKIGSVNSIHYKLEEILQGVVIDWTGAYPIGNYQSYATNAFSGSGFVAAGWLWGTFDQTFLGHALGYSSYNP